MFFRIRPGCYYSRRQFKSKLTEFGIDTNNNGEIEVTEGEAYYGFLDFTAIDVGALKPGTYFIEMVSGNEKATRKFTKM